MRSDPGIGNAAAEVGTVEWAQHVRLTMQSIVHNLPKAPERLKGYVELCKTHRAWTLLNKPDGSTFATFDEYCEHKEPWGLGKSYDELRPFLEAATEGGARGLRLVVVAPAKEVTRGEHGHYVGVNPEVNPVGVNPEVNPVVAARRRAIAERAPEPARALYRHDLLGEKEAARLGPKSPTPEQAERVTTIAIALAETAKAAPKPTTPAAQRALKRTLTAKARALLGEQPEDRVAKLARTVGSLGAEDQARLVELLEAAHPTATGVVAHVRALMPADDAPRAEPERCSPLSCSVCGNTEKRDARAADIENVIERVMSIEADGAGRARVRDRVLRFLSESVNYGEDVPF